MAASPRNRLSGQRFSGDDDRNFAPDTESEFMQECAKPQYCMRSDSRIDPKVATDIVRVICSNPKCTKSQFMHKDCFGNLEGELANYLSAQQMGKQRNLSSSERFSTASLTGPAIWTTFRAQELYCNITECSCQHGYLRKDVAFIPIAARKGRRKSAEQRLPNSPGTSAPTGSSIPVFTSASPSSLATLSDAQAGGVGPEGGGQQGFRNASSAFGSKQQGGVAQANYQREASGSQQFVPQRGGYNAGGNKNQGGRHRVPSLGGTASQIVPANARGDHRDRERQRAISLSFAAGAGSSGMTPSDLNVALSPTVLSPTGSFPVQQNASASGQNERGSLPRFNGFDFFSNKDQAASGNIFARRTDMSAFARLSPQRLNAYSIKLEEDGPHGDDDTRYFVLNNLTAYRATNVECVLCGVSLTVYDRYPLLDGVFFLSPVDHTQRGLEPGIGLPGANSQNGPTAAGGNAASGTTPGGGPRAFPVSHSTDTSRGTVYLHAICMMCTEGRSAIVRCRDCNTVWDGRVLMLGSMYTYDVFAATICCRARLACNRCQKPVVDPNSNSINSNFKYFSYFSKSHTCPHCGEQEAHFAKPLAQQFIVKRSMWGQ